MITGPSLKVLLPLAAAALLFGTACGGGGAEPSNPPEPTPEVTGDTPVAPEPETPDAPAPPTADTLVISTPEAASAAIGQVVRVVGTALNAKLAAVVSAGDLKVYCLDRPDGWPSEQVRQEVAVIGTLELTEEFAATTAPDGSISTGTDGGIFAMRECRAEALAP